MDISVYCDTSRDGRQGFKYVVNEVNRTFSTCLYYKHGQPQGMADGLFQHLTQVLHHVVVNEFLITPPPPSPVAV